MSSSAREPCWVAASGLCVVAAYCCSVERSVCFVDLAFFFFYLFFSLTETPGFGCFLSFKGDSRLSVCFSFIRNKNINKNL